jgi:biopolymer transport protein ExbB
LKDFVISKAAGKTKLDTFMTKYKLSNKEKLMRAIAACDDKQGSVQIQSNL